MKKFIFTVFIIIFGQVFGQNLLNARKRSILDRESAEVVLCTVQKLREISQLKAFPTLLELVARECCRYDNVLEVIEETNKCVMDDGLNSYFVKHWIERNCRLLSKPFESKTLIGDVGRVNSVLALPNGNIVTLPINGHIRIWDFNTLECIQVLVEDLNLGAVAAILPNGNIVIGSRCGTTKIFNSNTGECLHTLTRGGIAVLSLAVLPNENVVIGFSDGTVKVWDSKTGKCLHILNGHIDGVIRIAILSNGNIVTGSMDKTVRVWDSNTGQCLHALVGHTDLINYVGVLPDGRVVTGSRDLKAKIWDANTGKCLQGWFNVISIAVLPNGNIVIGFLDGATKIWDANIGQYLYTLSGHSKYINNVAVLPNGNIVTAPSDWHGTVKIWDANTGECLHDLVHIELEPHTWETKLTVLLNGNIVTLHRGGTPKIWDINIEERINDLISDNGNVTLRSLRRVKRLIEESNFSAVAASSSAS